MQRKRKTSYSDRCLDLAELCNQVAAQYPSLKKTCEHYAQTATELAKKPRYFWNINRIDIDGNSVKPTDKTPTIRFRCWCTAESFAQSVPAPELDPMSSILQEIGIIDYRILTGENASKHERANKNLPMKSSVFLDRLKKMSPYTEYIGDENYTRLARVCSVFRCEENNIGTRLESLAMHAHLEKIMLAQKKIRDRAKNPNDMRGRNRDPNKTKSAQALKRFTDIISNSDNGILPDSEYASLGTLCQNIKYCTSACIDLYETHAKLLDLYKAQTALRPPRPPRQPEINVIKAQDRRAELLAAGGNYTSAQRAYVLSSLTISRKRVQESAEPTPRALKSLRELEECWAAYMAYQIEKDLPRQ
jgi:hypothetical protein